MSAPVCRDLVPPSDELKGETETSPPEEKEAATAVVVQGKKGAVSLSDNLRCYLRSCGKALGQKEEVECSPNCYIRTSLKKKRTKRREVTGLETTVKNKNMSKQ